jgi:phenylalanyl-tRNA synthetase alpha chain
MKEQIENLKKQFESDLGSLSSTELKKKYLSKESELMKMLGSMKDLSPEDRKEVGREGNMLRRLIEEKVAEVNVETKHDNSKYNNLDVTLPGKRRHLGTKHPSTLVMEEMNEIFKQLGFSVYAGPEMETDEYVFEKLNLPKDHPARSLQDTLMIEEPEVILRSHTSSVEIRAMENEKLPLRIVVPGRAFRYEDLNQTNHFAFFQYEGLAVGEGITMADLKGTFETFAKAFFGAAKIRIRAKYYPQVEPGCGLDVICTFCEGSGCPVCKKRGWIEVSGGGMVHYNALKAVGIDPKKYSGFAFGMGFDRIVMQKYKIDDIRKLYNGTLY